MASHTVPLPGGIPPNHKPHTESNTTILLPKAGVFLNPPQQFNRDLSVAVIRAWNERRKEELELRSSRKNRKHKKEKKLNGEVQDSLEHPQSLAGGEDQEQPIAGPSTERQFQAPSITILEPLSATGLRAIRYAKEIPDIKHVYANDISPSACDAIRLNVAYNGVGEEGIGDPPREDGHLIGDATVNGHEETVVNGDMPLPVGRRHGCTGTVKVTEGDACALMNTHRDQKKRADVVDLDPYGTAAPFIDAAVSSVADGGLLCVTCTDTAVFAGSQYPEKAYSNYGGASVNAEYKHEVGLRLIINSIASAAARYGRYVTPLLSFSIDFYARVFLVVNTHASHVKDLASQTGIVFVCSNCDTPVIQPLGRIVEKSNVKGDMIKSHKASQNVSSSGNCAQCGSRQHLGGPMWIGPLQDPAFARRVLDGIEGQKDCYATWPRMHGMLTLAESELSDPFFFTCNKLASNYRASCPPTSKAISALLNGGYKVSRSHAAPGSVKTDAPWSFIQDIIREWIKETPVRMDKIPEGSPARGLLAKPQEHEISFSKHPDAARYEKGDKVVFYQENPLPNWGPAARAKVIHHAKDPAQTNGAGTPTESVDAEQGKRKSTADEPDQHAERKRVKNGDEKSEEDAMNF